jgi:hypothetical protein
MTLTPQDRETIERAGAIIRDEYVPNLELLNKLLAILDRLAVEKPAAPSSPLPDAICARCGKRYDNHQGEFCTCGPLSTDTFLPTPDKPEQDDFYQMVDKAFRGSPLEKAKGLADFLRGAWRIDIAASEARIMAEIETAQKRYEHHIRLHNEGLR